MTVEAFVNAIGFKTVCLPSPEKEIDGVYVGDLLSRCMSRVTEGCLWITIMSNRNIVAVATLADTACVILAEDVQPDEGVAELAQQKGINLLLSPDSAYHIALRLRDCL